MYECKLSLTLSSFFPLPLLLHHPVTLSLTPLSLTLSLYLPLLSLPCLSLSLSVLSFSSSTDRSEFTSQLLIIWFNLIVEDDYLLDEALNGFDDWERYEEMGSDSQDDWLPSELLNNQDPNSKSTQTPFVGNVKGDMHKKPLQNHPAGGRSRNKDTGRNKGYDPPLSATPTDSPEVPVNLTRAVSIQTLSEQEIRELEELTRFA